MIRYYGTKYKYDFPNPDIVLQTLENYDIAVVKDIITEHQYILTPQLRYWIQISELAQIAASMMSVAAKDAEWVMSMDDFENGWGEREYPHCSNCHSGVYRHDAGSHCPFCGKTMKNPMTT